MLNRAIYLLGMRVRNDKISDNYDFLLRSQEWGIDKLLRYQEDRLKEIVNQAYGKSEYYREKYMQHNISPGDINCLEDIKKIPPITKEELLKNAHKIQVTDFPEKLFYSETSGSTGRPLVFYRNKDWDAWHRASIYRGYSWYGVKPWERNGYLWGYNTAFKRRVKTRFYDFLQNRFRLFSYKDEEIDKFIKKLTTAVYLGGYSSMVYEVAKRINNNGDMARNLSLKMVKGTSEKIFDAYQGEVQRAFGKKMISEYGSAEAGIIAFECPRGNMHVNMETDIVEVEANEIIVTNLVSKSFPIIRYKLGDYIALDTGVRCECGMQHDVIREVVGRVGKVIYGYKYQYPSLTLYYVFKNLAMEHGTVLNYQAVQREKGELQINIEKSLEKREREYLMGELYKYFAKDLNIKVAVEVNLKSTDRKKSDFISELLG